MYTTFLLNRHSRDKAKRLIDAAPSGFVSVVREPRRSTSQNARMWAMLSDVAQQAVHNGSKYSPEAWKTLFMHAMGQEVSFMTGLSGEPFPVGFRSSRLSVPQMVELQDFIECWCANNGVTPILPEHAE